MRSRSQAPRWLPAGLLALLVACDQGREPGPPASPAAGEDPVVLEVGRRVVRLPEYQAWLTRKVGLERIHRFTEEICVQEKARQLGVSATDARIEEEIERRMEAAISRRYGGDRDAFMEREVASRGLTIASWKTLQRDDVRFALELEAVARALEDPVVEEAALRRLFERLYGPKGRRPRLRHIIILVDPVPAGVPRDDREAVRLQKERAALEVARRAAALLASGEDFAKVAQTYSRDDPSARRGGLVEHYFPGRFGPQADRVIASLEPGQVSDPIRTPRGFQIFRVDSVQVTRFEDVRQELKARLGKRWPGSEETQRLLRTLVEELAPAIHWPPRRR